VLTGGNGPGPTYAAVVSWSDDGGDSWNRVNLSDTSRGSVYHIAFAASNPSVVYAGGHRNYTGKTWRSTDFGRNWIETGARPSQRVFGLAVHPEDPDIVYAAAQDSAWKTTDGGATWNCVGGGYYLSDVKLFPGCPDTVIVCGRYGVALSEDGGATWSSLNAGLASLNVTCLDFSVSAGIDLFAGTKGGAVCRYSFLTGVKEWRSVAMPVGSRVTPNPVMRGGLVRLAVPWDCVEPVVLFDRSGREAACLVRVGPAARCEYRLPADIRSGVYFVSVPGRDDVAPAKLVVR
jgi:hypothetical protein